MLFYMIDAVQNARGKRADVGFFARMFAFRHNKSRLFDGVFSLSFVLDSRYRLHCAAGAPNWAVKHAIS